MDPLLEEAVLEYENLFPLEELELPYPPQPCTCGHYRCKGAYVKTHVGQTVCLFSFREMGLDKILPMYEEVESLKVEKFIAEIIPLPRQKPRGWAKMNRLQSFAW